MHVNEAQIEEIAAYLRRIALALEAIARPTGRKSPVTTTDSEPGPEDYKKASRALNRMGLYPALKDE